MKLTIPESFNLNDPQQSVLYIKTDHDCYSFVLHNTQTNETFHQRIEGEKQSDAFINFKQAFFENDFFALQYKKVCIVNHTPSFTFVPSVIYEEKDKKAYFDFNFSRNTDLILNQKIVNPELTILHTLPDNVYDFFVRSFLKPEFTHHQAPLISHFQEKTAQDNNRKMVVNIHKKGMDVLCYSHTSFILGNHLLYQNLDDLAYFALFIWKQLKFDQANDIIYISGVQNQAELAEALKDYLKNIVLIEQPTDIPFEISLIQLCES